MRGPFWDFTLRYFQKKTRIEKLAHSLFFKTNSQDSYRRDGIFEKAWLRQTEIGGVKVIVGWWFVWYLVHVL